MPSRTGKAAHPKTHPVAYRYSALFKGWLQLKLMVGAAGFHPATSQSRALASDVRFIAQPISLGD